VKLKFATGHVALRVSIEEMQTLIKDGTLSEAIDLSGGKMNVVVSLVDENIANMQFDVNSATIGFVFPRDAAETEAAKPTRGGIGGYFDQGVFSLAIDMHDVRKQAGK
jgi:hypothetical protein